VAEINYDITIDDQNQYVVELNEQGPQGANGEDGNGIVNITKTSTSGLIDTYTINYTNGGVDTFTVTNGSSIQSIAKTSTSGLVDTYTITQTNGTTSTFTVTNGSNISTIAKTATVGLVDTYTVTLTNGNTTTFNVTNGYSPTANVVKEGGEATITISDKSGTTTAKVYDGTVPSEAMKGYLDAGELLTDAKGLEEVTNYAHSTFDISKFTLEGTPSITNDGIASGFGSSNYPYVSMSNINLNAAHTWEIDCRIKTSNVDTGQQFISINPRTSAVNFINIAITTDGKIRVTLSTQASSSSTGRFVDMTTTDTLSANTEYNIKVRYTGSAYLVLVNDAVWAQYNTETKVGNTTSMYLNIGTRTDAVHFNGTVDLKYLSVKVDGQTVFNGNKTGIDTIKPNDYTAYTDGTYTSTITTDGRLIYNSNLNPGRISAVLPSVTATDNWKLETFIHIGNKIGTVTSQDSYFIFQPVTATSFSARLKINTNNKLQLDMGSSNSSWWLNSSYGTGNTNITLSQNSNYLISVEKVGRNVTVSVYKDGVTLIGTKTFTATSDFAGIYVTDYAFRIPYSDGWADINGMKFYKNGDLVWQGCLKIPYTQSKTGSKITDSYYRFRINDMYNQFGYAPYYTLSNTDYTLPYGELYGLYNRIGAASAMPSDKYKDLTLGSSGDTYVAPADGWFALNKMTNSTNQYANFVNETNGINMTAFYPTTGSNLRLYIPAKRSDVIKCSYNAGGTTNVFRFVYAQGAEVEK
jgi:hypothetical protein